ASPQAVQCSRDRLQRHNRILAGAHPIPIPVLGNQAGGGALDPRSAGTARDPPYPVPQSPKPPAGGPYTKEGNVRTEIEVPAGRAFHFSAIRRSFGKPLGECRILSAEGTGPLPS